MSILESVGINISRPNIMKNGLAFRLAAHEVPLWAIAIKGI